MIMLILEGKNYLQITKWKWDLGVDRSGMGRPGKQGKHSRFRYAMVLMLAYFFLTSLRFGMS